MKKIVCIVMILFLLMTFLSCGKKPIEVPKTELETTVTEPEPEPVCNPLTGLPLQDENNVNRRPVAVMLNNIEAAMPQHGVSDADIIFEYNVEGGITRMVGFFQEIDKIGTIGSVRSARACFVETVLGMDAIYAHAGGSTEAIDMISYLGIDDINESNSAFWRDQDRAQIMSYEHTLMTSGELLWNYITDHGLRTQHEAGYTSPFTFVADGTPSGGITAEHITVPFFRL